MGRAIWILAALAVVLSGPGCVMVGPEYEEPDPPLESDWLDYEDPRLDATSPLAPDWWRTAFRDPVLDQLIEISLADNLTLRSAGLRVMQARQQLAIAVGNQYPQEQDLAGSAGIERAQGRSDDVYDFGFNVSWEADIWGRFRRQVETASALLDASLAGYDFRQTITLTTPRGIEDFLNGIIYRFSIGWYWQAVRCSVTGEDWFASPYRPGQVVTVAVARAVSGDLTNTVSVTGDDPNGDPDGDGFACGWDPRPFRAARGGAPEIVDQYEVIETPGES